MQGVSQSSLLLGSFDDDIGIDDTKDSFGQAVEKAYATVENLVLSEYADPKVPRLDRGVRGFMFGGLKFVVYFSIDVDTLITKLEYPAEVHTPQDWC